MTGYRPDRAATADRVSPSPGFGQRFTLFVDTEEEFDWTAPFRRDARAVTAADAIPAAAGRLVEQGAAPVFLVDHPIATDPRAIAALAAALEHDRVGVGTQLHPWVSPPFEEEVSARNSFLGNLPLGLQAAKLDALTQAITTAFARGPRIFRAGRYGLGPGTIELLAPRGYRIDSSMRAHYSYAGEGGPDYSDVGNHPFRVAGLVELAFTTVFTGALRRAGPSLHRTADRVPRGHGLLSRTGLLNRVSLTPEDMPLADALEAVRVAIGDGLPILNLAFHSPSLVPGHTPYVRDAADLRAFWRWWDAVLALLAQRGVASASEGEVVAALG
ncbi:hypothetical protein SAMN06297144_2715 [Sphingomonas guangdongensis]|uniref:WalW protein n=1 Tax=Sphingomonas guangdongensis TaxID=1141890 RepID=A0A285R0D2_9SPHN|nr:WalW protein [Sphingomonas guangdongensis]SOB87583.1 hypothetical protein SAMN06297144_2715 [Sphingomonas guangdongensis]